ncbi:MAG: argininosuccinate lyase, partial [Gemmataceae bacterium]|nr:argininosuccinate lyase [Gemmataceae bacterium]
LKRVNGLPLGAAALAGTSLPIDRHRVAEKLGFSEVARNSLDVSSDRDFVAEYLFCLALMGVHLSNWAEEWVLWSTTEFNTIELPDEFCTGSSIMPHKKNPDVLELTRGRAAKTIAALQQVLVLLKGLPTAYNRDLQEDKPPLFEATDTILGILEVAPPLILGARFKTESINARLEDGFLDATTLMEGLIARGIPMRSAHEMIGKLVQECETKRCRLIDLPVSRLEEICPNQGQQLRELLGVKNAIETFKSYGSTAPNQVRAQLEIWQEKLQANP